MEFLLLLIVTLLISIVVAGLVVLFFRKPVDKIFNRIIGEEISTAWRKFLTSPCLSLGFIRVSISGNWKDLSNR